VNCLANHFGDEGLATLLTAIEGTSVRSLCGLSEGETTADFSGQNLSPIDCKILAAEYDFRGFIAAVNALMISNNFVFGSKESHPGWGDNQTIHDVDNDQSGWNDLCEQLKDSKVTSFTACDIGMGPVALRTLSTSLPAALTEVDVRRNMLDEAVLEQLRAAAPETCKIFPEGPRGGGGGGWLCCASPASS
jgi:hypothetical protein